MNIVVCVKQVPDTAADRKLKPSDSTVDRASVDGLINELDEYAIEEGLQIAEAQRGAGNEAEVTILTMGPEKAAESIRKALSMGADKAVHLLDDGLAGSDALSTSYALAQVLGQIGFDLVICGSESTDARMGVMAAMLAEHLVVPQASLASKVDIDGSDPAHPPRLRRRLPRGGDLAARGDQRGREDQRAAVPVVQGHHGGEEEAGARRSPSPTLGIDPAQVGLARRGHRGGRFRPAAAAAGRHDRQGRRRRWRQGRRVPRRAEVHLRPGGETAWLRSWCSRSTRAAR